MIRESKYPEQPPAVGSFIYQSELANQQMESKLQQTQSQLNVVQDILTVDSRYRNAKGNTIANVSREKLWFARCVAFVFALGRIYDEDDDTKMSAIMNYFNDESGSAYLENHYRVESYQSSPLVQEIEKKLRIGNGNYHVFMVPIVYADDAQLKEAPESQFKRKGILDKYTSWDAIIDYMKDTIVKYGMVTELRRSHDLGTHELGSVDLPEDAPRPTSRYDEMTKFNYNDLNGNIGHMGTISQTLKVKEEITNDFNKRQRKGKFDREGEETGAMNAMKRKSLYSRMSEDTATINFDIIPQDMKGVALQVDDRMVPPTKRVDEFQIYDDEVFDAQFNKNMMHEVAGERQAVPRFYQYAARANSGQARSVNTSMGSLGGRAEKQFSSNYQGYNPA